MTDHSPQIVARPDQIAAVHDMRTDTSRPARAILETRRVDTDQQLIALVADFGPLCGTDADGTPFLVQPDATGLRFTTPDGRLPAWPAIALVTTAKAGR